MNMKCPCCKSEIVIGPKKQYETLDEHVCSPNSESPFRDTLICSNEDCITRKGNAFWDHFGDMYGGIYIPKESFIKENNSPFGSLGRKTNVEIYKVGLKSKTYLSPAWLLWFYQPFLEYNYRSNENGDVLKKSISVKFLKKDNKISKQYTILAIPFWNTLIFLSNRFHKNKESYDKNQNTFYLINMFRPSPNRAWIYRTFERIAQHRYPAYYIKYLQLKES